MLDNADMKM